ncbi:putative E3 ubiquitin-protein ligase SINA-like 9 [Abrus precatorius]|uniref:RING-type E3 ubiquitin transferase n=1 Tax=Abrus precatorius TaxID=3816 RepID=A0A8B8K587_ABRPR|nr:putative E3 ubiquitin-protein ligase SINA-like 9 [Abrus precatorius]
MHSVPNSRVTRVLSLSFERKMENNLNGSHSHSNGERGISRYPVGRRPRNPIDEIAMRRELSNSQQERDDVIEEEGEGVTVSEEDSIDNEEDMDYDDEPNAPLPGVNRAVVAAIPAVQTAPTLNDIHTNGVYMELSDPDVLDCYICYEPLYIPVYQCINGHVVCVSCFCKIQHKCPFCSMYIGNNRCRAMENVLEAVKITCPNAKYGCNQMIRYSEKREHEKTCDFVPCSCLQPFCDFVGSSKVLAKHLGDDHFFNRTKFNYGEFFNVSISVHRKFSVLQSRSDDKLFAICNKADVREHEIFVCFIGPIFMVPQFSYEIKVVSDNDGESYELPQTSVEKNIQGGRTGFPSVTMFLNVPLEVFRPRYYSRMEVELQLRITRVIGAATNSEAGPSGLN